MPEHIFRRVSTSNVAHSSTKPDVPLCEDSPSSLSYASTTARCFGVWELPIDKQCSYSTTSSLSIYAIGQKVAPSRGISRKREECLSARRAPRFLPRLREAQGCPPHTIGCDASSSECLRVEDQRKCSMCAGLTRKAHAGERTDQLQALHKSLCCGKRSQPKPMGSTGNNRRRDP